MGTRKHALKLLAASVAFATSAALAQNVFNGATTTAGGYSTWDSDLINVEADFENNWLAGVAMFDNSFDQDSWFVYMGYEWPLFHSKYFYFKLAGGLLYGYKDEYKDKIPLNGWGIAPAIIPILGAQYKWFFTELDIAGTAAITWTAGIQF